MNSVHELIKSLHTGFVSYKNLSREDLQPKLLINDRQEEKKVLTTLLRELEACDAFFFSVAFITSGGIASIINVLTDLEERGVKGQIIASSYQDFTQPQALRQLLKFKNIELRIVTENNFHAKSYIFRRGQEYNLIIGSSNLTQNALSFNKEWNLKVTSRQEGELLKYVMQEFDRTFSEATIVDEEWLKSYEEIYKKKVLSQKRIMLEVQEQKPVLPNQMQLEALKGLEEIRGQGKDRALLISATGTGKTYLSAFDVARVKPKRMLFVVHRENITRASRKNFRNICDKSIKMGILSGREKDYDADYLFSTIQTLSKEDVLKQFRPDAFDYIIIDEVHRSGAESYERVLNYFKPKFLLGMSATPERTDGYDIYKTFDYNIAYEIRLGRALEEQMLSPFHYYGVSELVIDGQVIDDTTAFNILVSEERVNRIIEKAELYGFDHGRVKGLVFCSNVKEAHELSRKFNERGYQTLALDGSNNEEEREDAICRLEKDEKEGDYLDYIFTVDIFNEGIDIPTVNQIIMLRPTQSAIVFVQQLGRGLRKVPGKEYVVVIDFIGNYANNYLVPIALYGDSSYNKDQLRKLISTGSCSIPGVSTVNFDLVTKERIYKAIDNTNMAMKKALVEEYRLMKYKIGKIPMMMDFIQHGGRDPFSFVDRSNSYYHFVSELEESLRGKLSVTEMQHLAFYSKEFGKGKRVEELYILKELIAGNKLTVASLRQLINNAYGYIMSEGTFSNAIRCLNGEFFKAQDQKKYGYPSTVIYLGEDYCITEQLAKELDNPVFKQFLIDVVSYGIQEFDKHYKPEDYAEGFIYYRKYSRKDVCRILNWPQDDSSTVYGYQLKHNTCPIFVTYHKSEDISESIKYEDQFIDPNHFSWMTRNNVRMESKFVQDLRAYDKTGIRIPLFIKKSDGEGTDFYYMGEVEPMAFEGQKDSEGRDIVNVIFEMQKSVEENLYYYLIQ